MKYILLLSLCLGLASAKCAGETSCSGHGTCSIDDTCTCYPNYMGGDCLDRVCPYSIAFGDIKDTSVTGRDVHYYAECGGKGRCDRSTGQCECYAGYSGKGCKRSTCPSRNGMTCSGHGTCETLSEVNSGYVGWDADKIQVCVCDPGYEDYDCGSRTCRKGDDPVSEYYPPGSTSQQTYETLRLTVTDTTDFAANQQIVLSFQDWRGQVWYSWALDVTALSVNSITEALVGLPNYAVPSVEVTEVTNDAQNKIFDIKFTDPMNSGTSPILSVHSEGCVLHGCQPVYDGVTLSGSGVAEVTLVTAGTTEFSTCSGRGRCDGETGLCACFPGYTGPACSTQSVHT